MNVRHTLRLYFIFSLFLYLLNGCCITDTQHTPRCYICESMPYHAPCLIDLSTGHILELSVYDNDPIIQGELAKGQTTGHVSLTMSGGMLAMTDAGNSAQTTIPTDLRTMNVNLFCHACQQAIHSIPNNGIVLADLYELEHIRYYIIEVGAEYSFRDYTIEIEQRDDTNELKIIVYGKKCRRCVS